MLDNLQPTAGKVEVGTRLDVAYFDQLRHQLDLEKTVIDNVAEGRDFIDIDGQSRHVLSYLGDFLFSPQRARTPVKALSGGERARLLLAKLFSKPANLLVLDEPTNDLDVETLELLEEVLLTFKGTVLMVSHDRAFLDNVVTSTLVFEGEGKVREYVGVIRTGCVRAVRRVCWASPTPSRARPSWPALWCRPRRSPLRTCRWRRRSSATSFSANWRRCLRRSMKSKARWPR